MDRDVRDRDDRGRECGVRISRRQPVARDHGSRDDRHWRRSDLRAPQFGWASLDESGKPGPGAAIEPSFRYIMTHSGYPYLLALVYAGYLGALYFVWTWFAAYLNAEYPTMCGRLGSCGPWRRLCRH
jgi:hypothetical protein